MTGRMFKFLATSCAALLGCSSTGLVDYGVDSGASVSGGTGGAAYGGGTSSLLQTGGWSNPPVEVVAGGTSNSAGGSSGYSTWATGGVAAQSPYCNGLVPPTAAGQLSVAAGYVTTGTFRGYGFTWVGDQSNTTTCITPSCDTTGCTPAFGATALCVTGVVAADTSYNSMVGVGFNLNQSSLGDSPSATNLGVGIIVHILSGDGSGDWAARVLLIDDAGAAYCVEAGSWTSGSIIPLTKFNTSCWDGSGNSLQPGSGIVSVHIVVPSDATQDRPFRLCLTNVESIILN